MSLRKKLGTLVLGLGLLGVIGNSNAQEIKNSVKSSKYSISFSSVSRYLEPFNYNGKVYNLETRAESTFWKNPECGKGKNQTFKGEHIATIVSSAVKNHIVFASDFDCDGLVDHFYSPELGINFYRSDIAKIKDEKEQEKRRELFLFADKHFNQTKKELNKNGLMKKTIDVWLKIKDKNFY